MEVNLDVGMDIDIISDLGIGIGYCMAARARRILDREVVICAS